MTTLHLTLEQTEALKETLESYLSDLSVEIADTDSFDFRNKLKEKRKILNEILDNLQ